MKGKPRAISWQDRNKGCQVTLGTVCMRRLLLRVTSCQFEENLGVLEGREKECAWEEDWGFYAVLGLRLTKVCHKKWTEHLAHHLRQGKWLNGGLVPKWEILRWQNRYWQDLWEMSRLSSSSLRQCCFHKHLATGSSRANRLCSFQSPASLNRGACVRRSDSSHVHVTSQLFKPAFCSDMLQICTYF